MKTAIFGLAIVLFSSAAQSQSFEEESTNPFSTLGGSVTFGFANMSQSGEFDTRGPSVGFGLAGKIDTDDYAPLYLEWSGFTAWGSNFTSNTVLQGADPYVYNSRRSPVGTVDLSTTIDATGAAAQATVHITDTTGDSATIFSSAFSPLAPATSVSQYATSVTDAGGIFTALTTKGETVTASAYGCMFDTTGTSLLGTEDGEESNTTITTTVDDSVRFSNQVLYFGNRISLGNDWDMLAKIGPTYRRFDRSNKTRTIINIDGGSGSASDIPEVTMDDNWKLNGKYYGAMLGASLSRQINSSWNLSLGMEAGLTKFKAKSETLETVNFAGTASSIPGVSNSLKGTSQIGRITGGLTHVTKNGGIISFGAFLDYMSGVPYLQFETVNTPNITTAGSAVTLSGEGETYQTYSIQKKKMIGSGLNFSFIYLF